VTPVRSVTWFPAISANETQARSKIKGRLHAKKLETSEVLSFQGGVTVVCQDQNNQVVTSGQSFPVGTTTVTCTGTDTYNNTASSQFIVRVLSFCPQDESNPGNVVLINAQSGEFSFCSGGIVIASRIGTLTNKGCIGSTDSIQGNRQVHIQWDTSAKNNLGAGTAYLQKISSGKIVCQITDKNMSNNTC
jgi:hypothetical protein